MRNHDESTSRQKSAWDLIEAPDGPVMHLFNLDAMLACTRMAIEHLNEQSTNADLCHLQHLVVLAEMEMTLVHRKLETILGNIQA